jgi:hypothetical protein
LHRFLSILAVVATIASPATASRPADRSDEEHPRIAAYLGQSGCEPIEEKDLAVVPHGFLLHRLNEFVPYEEAAASPDGRYWRCGVGGQRTKFLAPEEGD